MKSLYPVQRAHVDRIKQALLQNGSALDSSQPGCGKTVMAIVTARELGKPLFVVCPKAVIPAWQREMEEQGVSGTVINYESLRESSTFGHWILKTVTKTKTINGVKTRVKETVRSQWVWNLPPNTLIVWDECHKCQSPTSQNCKMLIASKEFHNLMLSATVADDPTELRGVGYILGLFDLPKFWNWCRSHGCKPTPWGAMEFDRRKTSALEKIHTQIYPARGHRLTVADVQDHFAENMILDAPLDFGDGGKIAKIYEEMGDELDALKAEMAGDSKNPAAQALVHQLRARQAVELCKIPLTIDMIWDELDQGRSVCVFLNFDLSIDAVIERLEAKGQRVAVVRGGQSGAARQEAIDSFQNNEVRVIVCNLEAGGVGVSLHDTDGKFPRTALISPNFNGKSLVQVLGRIHRAGGKSPCIQRLLVAAGTIEEKVAAAVKGKIRSQEILNGPENHLSHSTSQVSYPANTQEPYPLNSESPAAGPLVVDRPHATHSPSALKMFEVCGSYKPRSGTSPAAEKGTRIHSALELGDITSLVDEEERIIAQKCADYLEKIKEANGGEPDSIHNEVRLDVNLGVGEKTFGTCDVVWIYGDRAVLVDYKTGYGAVDDAEINCQAWAYSIGVFQKFNVREVDFFFLLPVRDEVSFATFTRERLPEMKLRLQVIIARAKAGGHFNPQPGVCDYCGNKANCKPLAEKALVIANQYSEGFKLPKNFGKSLSENDDPEALAQLLKLAPIMESWAEEIKKLALDRALNEGMEIPGYRLMERKTPRSITSALQAYEAVKDTVSVTDFLAACGKVSVPDLEKFYAEGLPRGKKGAGKQELVDRLTDIGCLKQEGLIHVLKAEKK